MTLEDLGMVLDWAAAEGWNPGVDDAEAFLAADPEGFFLTEDDDQPIAAISVVNHSDDVAFLGLYICRPEFRGRGVGYTLWRHALEHAGDRTVGLDGVADQQANYARSGFVLAGETRRFEGELEGQHDPDIRVATDEDIQALIAAEAAAFGFAKERFNDVWFRPMETRKTYVSSRGFATVRTCRDGSKIGPLIADDIQTAVRLVRHIAAQTDGKLIIDVPDENDALADWCAAQGMLVSFGTARMYRGAPPVTGPGIHAASTLELG